jgi:hypothetical protein
MVILPKQLMFNSICIKIPMIFFRKREKPILNFRWKHKNPQISKAKLSKKSNAVNMRIPHLKLHYTATETTCYWYKNRHKHQLNRRPRYKSA